jgi:hypothetical protein
MSCQDSCAFFYLDETKIFSCNIACTEAYPDDVVAEGCEPFTTKVLSKLTDLPDALGEEGAGTTDATDLPAPSETETTATETLLPAEEAPLAPDPEDPTVTDAAEPDGSGVPTFSVSLPADDAATTTKTTRKTIAVGKRTTKKKTTTEVMNETLPPGSSTATTRSVNRITLVTGSRSSVTRPDPLAGQPGGLIDQIKGGAIKASPDMNVAAAAVFGLIAVAIGV